MKYPGSPERIMELLGELRVAVGEANEASVRDAQSLHSDVALSDVVGRLDQLQRELVEEISQTPYAKLVPGEPFFFLRAQDALFGQTLMQYADSFVGMGGDVGQYGELVRLAGAGVVWQSVHPELVKVAD